MYSSRSFRLIVGMSGATGQIYGIRLLEVLKNDPRVETHLIMSEWSEKTIGMETDWHADDVRALADKNHDLEDLGATVSSGSFHRDAMVVIPCSIKSLSAIAYSLNSNLLVRAADVTLKERKPLILVARETPLHLGHLHTMVKVTNMGATLVPPVPAFYNHPRTLDDIVLQTVNRVLDLVGLHKELAPRWSGDPADSIDQTAKQSQMEIGRVRRS
jgi:4-hydroxy-3-polyprenylbenzoate decarboxylase